MGASRRKSSVAAHLSPSTKGATSDWVALNDGVSRRQRGAAKAHNPMFLYVSTLINNVCLAGTNQLHARRVTLVPSTTSTA